MVFPSPLFTLELLSFPSSLLVIVSCPLRRVALGSLFGTRGLPFLKKVGGWVRVSLMDPHNLFPVFQPMVFSSIVLIYCLRSPHMHLMCLGQIHPDILPSDFSLTLTSFPFQLHVLFLCLTEPTLFWMCFGAAAAHLGMHSWRKPILCLL